MDRTAISRGLDQARAGGHQPLPPKSQEPVQQPGGYRGGHADPSRAPLGGGRGSEHG